MQNFEGKRSENSADSHLFATQKTPLSTVFPPLNQTANSVKTYQSAVFEHQKISQFNKMSSCNSRDPLSQLDNLPKIAMDSNNQSSESALSNSRLRLQKTNRSKRIRKMHSGLSAISDSGVPKKNPKPTDSGIKNDISPNKDSGMLSKPGPGGQPIKLGSLTKPVSANPGNKGSCPKCNQGQCSDHFETQPSGQANQNMNHIQAIKSILYDLKDGKAVVKRKDNESLESNGSKSNKDNPFSQKIASSFSNIEGPIQSINDSSEGYREAIKIIERFEEAFRFGVSQDLLIDNNQTLSLRSHIGTRKRKTEVGPPSPKKDRFSKHNAKAEKFKIALPYCPSFNEEIVNINMKTTWFYFDPRSVSDGNDRETQVNNQQQNSVQLNESLQGQPKKDTNDVCFQTPRNEPKPTIANQIVETRRDSEQRYPGWEREQNSSENLPRNEQNSGLAIQPTLFCDGLIQLNSQFHLDVSPISRLNVLQRDLYNNSFLNFGQKGESEQFQPRSLVRAVPKKENLSEKEKFGGFCGQPKLTLNEGHGESKSDLEKGCFNQRSDQAESLDSYVPQIQKFHPRVIQELRGGPNLPKKQNQSNTNFGTDIDGHFGQTFSQVCQIFNCQNFRLLACVHRIDQNEYLIKVCRNKKEGLKEAQFYGLLASSGTSNGVHNYRFSWCENSQVYIVLESCLGSLKDLFLKEKRLIPISLLWTVLEDGLRALAFLHRNRIAHIDVSPSNFLLTKNGKFKIWNLSHALAIDKCKEFYDYDEGEFRYMAPELRVDIPSEDIESGKPDFFKSDVYSFGLVMTELMLMPQSFDSVPDFTTAIPESELIKLIRARNVPSELKQVVLKMLRTNPAKRPTSKRLLKLVKGMHNFKRSSLKLCSANT